MQQIENDIQQAGGLLIAISPMLKPITAALVKKHNLQFPVLSDMNNKISSQFGLVFTLSDSLHPIYSNFNIDIPKSNGDNSYTLPIPATYIIDKQGAVRFRFADVDHTKRLDPRKLIDELNNM